MIEMWNSLKHPMLGYIGKHLTGPGRKTEKFFLFVKKAIPSVHGESLVERMRSAILNGDGINIPVDPEKILTDSLELGLSHELEKNKIQIVEWWTNVIIESMLLRTRVASPFPLHVLEESGRFLQNMKVEREKRSFKC